MLRRTFNKVIGGLVASSPLSSVAAGDEAENVIEKTTHRSNDGSRSETRKKIPEGLEESIVSLHKISLKRTSSQRTDGRGAPEIDPDVADRLNGDGMWVRGSPARMIDGSSPIVAAKGAVYEIDIVETADVPAEEAEKFMARVGER